LKNSNQNSNNQKDRIIKQVAEKPTKENNH